MLAVRDVLLHKYPRPLSAQPPDQNPDYGFVHLPAGTKLWRGGCKRDEDPNLVTSAAGRYRAVYNPANAPGWVELVVPGYGICTTQMEGSEKDKFISSKNTPFEEYLVQRSSSLTMGFASMENDTVVTQLLKLFGRELKSLMLMKVNTEIFRRPVTRDNQVQLELSLLAEACPCLRDVVVAGFNVTVAADSEALRNWRVYQMFLLASFDVPDLASYLADSTLRLTQNLCQLEITTASVDTKEAQTLKAFDGDFLPKLRVTGDTKAKLAMVSVVEVYNGGKSKATGHLDSLILSLILRFASTPVYRSVVVDGLDKD